MNTARDLIAKAEADINTTLTTLSNDLKKDGLIVSDVSARIHLHRRITKHDPSAIFETRIEAAVLR